MNGNKQKSPRYQSCISKSIRLGKTKLVWLWLSSSQCIEQRKRRPTYVVRFAFSKKNVCKPFTSRPGSQRWRVKKCAKVGTEVKNSMVIQFPKLPEFCRPIWYFISSDCFFALEFGNKWSVKSNSSLQRKNAYSFLLKDVSIKTANSGEIKNISHRLAFSRVTLLVRTSGYTTKTYEPRKRYEGLNLSQLKKL